MKLLSPEWLLIIPFIFWLGRVRPGLRLSQPLRALIIVLSLMILCQLSWRKYGAGLDLWVLLDRSASANENVKRNMKEWFALLKQSASSADRIHVVDFSDGALLRSNEMEEGFEANPNQTRLKSAVFYALSRKSQERQSRLLVFTDGFSTETLNGVSERLLRDRISMDYRLTSTRGEIDYQIDSMNFPMSVQIGEPFLVDVKVSGYPDAEIDVELIKNSLSRGFARVKIVNGVGRLRFIEKGTSGGAFCYKASIKKEGDSVLGNNTAIRWVEVKTGPRALVVTRYENDPVAAVLKKQGYDLQVVNNPQSLNVGDLSGASVVYLNNIHASLLPNDFIKGLVFYVKHQGGGFCMTGGANSFGAGGYFNSPVDELIPVSIELREEHRKLLTALSIVLDRSGSMAVEAGGGMKKMDLANAGAAKSVELLGNLDLVNVFAVDSSSHQIVKMSPVGQNRNQIIDTVRRIASEGGGIFVYTGLKDAWSELKKTDVGQRHVILFADAADAEEPEGCQNLLAEMRKGGATVSVIGMGKDTDCDAQFLKNVANWGGGRIFFSDDPMGLPALFAQETVSVARSAFLKDRVGLKPTGEWNDISGGKFTWLSDIDGYNLSYLKSEASVAAISLDEYKAPLMAFWRRGIGRAAALSFPVGGEYSDRVRQWNSYGDFIQTLTRWLASPAKPVGVSLKTEMDGTLLRLTLRHDESWNEIFSSKPPQVWIIDSSSVDPMEASWSKINPYSYSSEFELESGKVYRGTIKVGEKTIPFGPVALGVAQEWHRDGDRLNEFKSICRLSGGVERIDLTSVWKSQREPMYGSARPILLILLLITLLIDAYRTRVGLVKS